MMDRKILMIMPSLPWPISGAEQSDRASGIRQLVRLGYQVKVIAKLPEWKSEADVALAVRELGVPIVTVPYVFSNKKLTFKDNVKKLVKKIINPLYLDGAALEYAEPLIQALTKKEIEEWQPDLVWFEYTYLWPLYNIARKYQIPVITRSLNFEPNHFLQEDGITFLNCSKYLFKFISEYLTLNMSNLVFSITPKEEKIYRRLGGKAVANLPLRGLPSLLRDPRPVLNHSPLKIFFMGSTYNVSHNLRALKFVTLELAPQMEKSHPGRFIFHIFGAKCPEEIFAQFGKNIKYEGYVSSGELETSLNRMDIALIPSFFGAGMQQKIFEPICRAIPIITSARGLADYPFINGEDVCCAHDVSSFASALLTLEVPARRELLGRNAYKKALFLFSQEAIDKIVQRGVEEVLSKRYK